MSLAAFPADAQSKKNSNEGRGSQHKSTNRTLTERDGTLTERGKRGETHRTINREWEDDRERRNARRQPGTPRKWQKGHDKKAHQDPRSKRHEQYSGELRQMHEDWHRRNGYALNTESLREQHRRLHEDLDRRHRALRQ